MRCKSSPYASSISKDKGPSSQRTKSLALWREQDIGLSIECKDEGYGPLCMISSKGLVMDFIENHPKYAREQT